MRIRLPLVAFAALALAAGLPAARAAGPDATAAQELRHDGQPLTLDEAVELVKRRYEARVVRAEESREGEEVVYRIRLIAADGRVFNVRVHARSGEVE